MTLEQLDEFAQLQTKLIGSEPFVRVYLQRLAPPDGVSLDDPVQQRAYIERLLKFVRKLPVSQNNVKAMVIGNLLRLNLREEKFDRALFLEYLALPRQAAYYLSEPARIRGEYLVDLNFGMQPQVMLPPVGDDAALVPTLPRALLRVG